MNNMEELLTDSNSEGITDTLGVYEEPVEGMIGIDGEFNEEEEGGRRK